MNRVVIRIVIEKITDDEFMELKKAIAELLEGIEGSRFDISLIPTKTPSEVA